MTFEKTCVRCLQFNPLTDGRTGRRWCPVCHRVAVQEMWERLRPPALCVGTPGQRENADLLYRWGSPYASSLKGKTYYRRRISLVVASIENPQIRIDMDAT